MLDNLFQWSNDWEMPFNIDKSNILHIWKKNPEFVYRWENGTLKTTKEDKDVGMHDHQQNFETFPQMCQGCKESWPDTGSVCTANILLLVCYVPFLVVFLSFLQEARFHESV